MSATGSSVRGADVHEQSLQYRKGEKGKVSHTEQQIICNVQNRNTPLPLIFINCNNEKLLMLVDTGSSISLISNQMFQKIKNHLSYKHIARNVTITTVNSKVKFYGCVQFTFKVGKLFFNQAFYTVDIDENSSFQGILGFDFIKKYNIILDIKSNNLQCKGSVIPLWVSDSSLEGSSNHISKQNMCKKSNVNNNDFDLDNCNSKKNNVINNNVKLVNKCIIESNSYCYALVVAEDNTPSCFIFEPTIKNGNIEKNVSVHQSDVSEANLKNKQFHILIRNKSPHRVCLNKGQRVGRIFETYKIKENSFKNTDEYTNLIQASEEVLQRRVREFTVADFKLEHLNNHDRVELEDLLNTHATVFSKSMSTLGHTDKVTPQLEFHSEYPVKTLPFPVPQSLQKEAQNQLSQLQEADIIKRNISSWACPMILVKKKSDGSGKQKFRLALDLRLLNQLILPSSYPLPKIQTIISEVSKYKYFSTLDLQQAYHQIHLPKELQDKLSFTTPWGTYCYKRLVFGLKTAASTFQSLMDMLVEEANVQGCFPYQDDIVVGADSFEEMKGKLKAIFEVFQKYNLTLSASKCVFHTSEIDYLGFKISHNTVRPITSNILKITSFPVPRNCKQLKRFIGLCSFYRHLISNFAQKMHPLIKLTSPKAKFKWTQDQNDAFQSLQSIFFQNPFVRQPDWAKPFFLNTDASKVAISATLLQEHDDEKLPVAYFSKALSSAEAKYPGIKHELMAIVRGVSAFRYYLYNRHFVILSDSKPLEFYKRCRSPADVTTRWLIELSEYSFTFRHLPGKNNVLADFLSRENFTNNSETLISNPELMTSDEALPILNEKTEQEYTNNVNNDCRDKDPPNEVSEDTILHEQLRDANISKIYNDLVERPISSKHKNYFIHPVSKILMFNKNTEENEESRNISAKIVVPHKLKAKILSIAHFSHLGIQKTYQFVSKIYHWCGMYTDTINFVNSCATCLVNKPHSVKPAPFQANFLPYTPGQFISLDIVGPFQNQAHVLTIIDHFSRHLELMILNNLSARPVVECLLWYITTYGRPALILTDLGTQFTSECFDKFSELMGVKLIHTSSGHPEANAISERVNLSIKNSIKSLVSNGIDFKHAVLIHKAMYNSSVHNTVGFSPNAVHFGRALSLIFDTYHPEVTINQLDKAAYIMNMFKDLNNTYKLVYSNLVLNQNNQNRAQQINARMRNFQAGDKVYLKGKEKFKPRYDGPFVIVKKVSEVNYLIRLAENPAASEFIVHINRLILLPPRAPYLNLEETRKPEVSPITPAYNLRPRKTITY